MSSIVNRIIPSRCFPGDATITLPRKADIDHVVAANLVARFVTGECSTYFESAADDSFDASSTRIKNHATISAGATPYHCPKSLCFDNRAFEEPKSNTALVIDYLRKLGMPMDFTDGMARFAGGDEACEYQFEADMIETFFEVCDSTSFAMQAAGLLLYSRCRPSKGFYAWREKRNIELAANDPEIQELRQKYMNQQD